MSAELYAWVDENGIVSNVSEWDGNMDPASGGLIIPPGIVMAPVVS
jgi:hypothetical protein